MEAFGPAGAVATGVLDALDAKSVDPILPTAIKNLFESVDTALTATPRAGASPRRPLADAAVTAIGVQPATVAATSRASEIQIVDGPGQQRRGGKRLAIAPPRSRGSGLDSALGAINVVLQQVRHAGSE